MRCLICLPNDGHAGYASYTAQATIDVADKTDPEYGVGRYRNPCRLCSPSTEDYELVSHGFKLATS